MPNASVVRHLLCSQLPSSQAMQGQAARKADDSDGACSNGISRHEVERGNTMHPAKSSIATGIFHHHRNMGSYVIQSYARQRNLLPPVKPLGTRSRVFTVSISTKAIQARLLGLSFFNSKP